MSAPIVERLRERSQLINHEAADTITDLLLLALQYRDDLKRPPTGDSLERRLEAIEAAIAKVVQP